MISFYVRLVVIVAGSILLFAPTVPAAAPTLTDVELIAPEPGREVVGKQPQIICRARNLNAIQNLLVLFDGVDISGLILPSAEGFSFTPVGVLPPGLHRLTIMTTGADGTPQQVDFTFSSRHSELFEEAGTENRLSLAWEKTIEAPDETGPANSYKLESNLGHAATVREAAWETRFTTNLRFLDQHQPATDPLEQGIYPADYLLSGDYQGPAFQANVQVGDVQISETPNTVCLSKRGGTFSAGYKNFKLKTFMVNSDDSFGFRDGLGIGGGTDEHIVGLSGEIGLLSDKIKMKTIYAAGGEPGSAFSTYSIDGDKKGNVLGFVLSSNFFNDKFVTEAEIDFSRFDADTSDEFSRQKDNAWKLKAGGVWQAYSYEILYECLGADYQVIGNPYLQADKKGGAINLAAAFPVHAACVSLSTYRDNVDDADLYATTDTSQGQIQYTFSKFTHLPLGLTYQRAQIESRDEPAYTPSTENITDTVAATVNYLRGPWNFGFQAGFSAQNDKTVWDNDTDAVNYTLSSGYYGGHFSICPAISFNRARYQPTRVRMDTCTATLDFRGTLRGRITYECAGTFSRMESSDHTTKQDTSQTGVRVAYTLPWKVLGTADPSVGLMGYYTTTEDYVYDNRSHDFSLLFVFSANVPFGL